MKTQMRFQKILFTVSLIIAALAIVYALGFCTGALAYFGYSWKSLASFDNSGNPRITSDLRDIFGADNAYLYYEMYDTYNLAQSYTDTLLVLGVVFILLVVVCYIFANSKRRNYYAANYITTIILAVYAVVWAVIAIMYSAEIQTAINGNIGWTELAKDYATIDAASWYSDSTWIYTVGYIISAVVILDAVALIFNCLWKFKLMRGEKQLLANGQNVKEVKEVA